VHPIAGVVPVGVGHCIEHASAKRAGAARDDDDGVAEIEVPDITALIEAPAVPRRGGEAHLAPGRDAEIAGGSHGFISQGEM